jgi:uncharacterized protein YlxP (DUF503 family)
MNVGLLSIRLRLPSRTLKEKRTIVKSVVERLRARYNASVAEVDDLDAVGFATIAAVCVSNDGAHADAQLQEMARAIQEWRLDAEVLDVRTEVIAVGE